MVNKNNKTSKNIKPRVMVNTVLLVLMAIAFGLITFRSVYQIQTMSKSFFPISDAPALCYDDEAYEQSGGALRVDSHICTSEVDPETDDFKRVDGSTESALFLYDKIVFSSIIRSGDLVMILATIGAMMTIASAVGAIVYFNHNR